VSKIKARERYEHVGRARAKERYLLAAKAKSKIEAKERYERVGRAKARERYQMTGKAKAKEHYLLLGRDKAKAAYEQKGLREELKRKYREKVASKKRGEPVREHAPDVCVPVAVTIEQL
jgi:uncharacterized protein YpmB